MIRTRISPPLVVLAALALILPVGGAISILTVAPPSPAVEGDTVVGPRGDDFGAPGGGELGAIVPAGPGHRPSGPPGGTNAGGDAEGAADPGHEPPPAETDGHEQDAAPKGTGGEDVPRPPEPEPDPGPPPAPPGAEAARFVFPAGYKIHRVAGGETLSQIAARYATSVTAICQTNRIITDLTQVGQPLFVQPGGDSAGRITVTRGPSGPGGGELLAWEHARWLFGSRYQATIRDPATGVEFAVVRLGGGNHADCEPLTVADMKTMKAVAGGGWTWTPKPVHVIVGGRTIAASMNFMPHSVQTITDNGFDGHFCVHFLHSRTHNTNSEDPAHRANVLRAAGLEGVALPPGL